MDYSSEFITLYSDIRSTSVRWLWYPYIASGKITLIQGDPGDGKSTMMMQLISEISKGGSAPDGKAFGRPRRVIYQCSEDSASDTIKPRMISAGAKCENIAFINDNQEERLTLEDERIRQAIIDFKPCLVVIDPLQAYLGNDNDLLIAGRVRKLMSRLSMIASAYDCAIVLIGHMNKKEGRKGIYRSLGSIDVIAAARSVLQVERDAENTNLRTVKQIKNSIGPDGSTFSFEISSNGFKWLECEGVELPEKKETVPEFKTKSEKATYLVRSLLENEDRTSKEMFFRLKEEGIGHRTAEETKKTLGVKSYRKNEIWYWKLEKPEENADV